MTDCVRVLAIDGDATYWGVVQGFFDSVPGTSFTFRAVGCLRDGLEQIPIFSPDVILIDPDLPDFPARDNVAHLYRFADSVPILVLSVLDNEQLALDAVKNGAEDYLVKQHIRAHSLVRCIKYSLERKQAQLKIRLMEQTITAELQRAREELEIKVRDRTIELAKVNDALRQEAKRKQRALEELDSMRSMLQLVIDNLPQGIYWKDRNSVYLGCNNTFAKDVGVSSVDFIRGKADTALVSDELAGFYRECDEAVMAANLPRYHNMESQQIDGQTIWLDTNRIPLCDSSGSVFGILGTYEDVTERVTLAQQREDFVATLTHDLKNPLIGADRVLELLLEGDFGELPSSAKDLVSKLRLSNASLSRMIKNLLEVYRYESNSQIINAQEMDLAELVRHCVDEITYLARSKSLAIEVNIPDGPCHICADVIAIGRVIENLLSNAIKFTPDAGSITVRLESNCDRIILQVQNSGPGIAPEVRGQLFQRFCQGIRGRRYLAGTGLGLYLCRQIIDVHQGAITYDSQPGAGTIFTVSLPIVLPSVSGISTI